jgi:predicted dehydrogenase
VSSLQGTRQRQAFNCTPQEAYQASYTAAQRHFAECLQNGSVPETVASDNINTLIVAFNAYVSAAQGQVVRIEE